jgi:DNA-binding response OmpR family regulator
MVTQILHQSGSGNLTATWTPAVVLVIDDDEHFRAMARSLLEQAGMSVLEADSVKHGLNQMQGAPVDVVVLDLVMPDEDGITGLRRIKAAHARVKLITVSGARAWEPYLRASALLGAHATLPKAYVGHLCPLLERLLGSTNDGSPGMA